MANADILRRLRDVCDRWDSDGGDVPTLHRMIVGHLSALEGPGPWVGMPDDAGRLSDAWWGRDPENAGMPSDRAAVDGVVRDLRRWLGEAEDEVCE